MPERQSTDTKTHTHTETEVNQPAAFAFMPPWPCPSSTNDTELHTVLKSVKTEVVFCYKWITNVQMLIWKGCYEPCAPHVHYRWGRGEGECSAGHYQLPESWSKLPTSWLTLYFRATGVTQQLAEPSLQAAENLGLTLRPPWSCTKTERNTAFSFLKLRGSQSDSCHHTNLSLC